MLVSTSLQSYSGPSAGFLHFVLRELMVRQPLPAGTIVYVCAWGTYWIKLTLKPDNSGSFFWVQLALRKEGYRIVACVGDSPSPINATAESARHTDKSTYICLFLCPQ